MKTETFACGHCQQGIICQEEHSGKTVECPHCGGIVELPQFVEEPKAKGAKGWAVASLALSCSSILTGPFGLIPGIICGHVALSRARGTPGEKGKGLAVSGLVAGYTVLAVGMVVLVLFPAALLGVMAKTSREVERASVEAAAVSPDKASGEGTVVVEFDGFENAGFGERGLGLKIKNGFTKPIKQLDMVYLYLDQKKKVLKEFSMSKRADDLGAALSTNRTVSMAPFMPPQTASVQVRLRKVTFADESTWAP